MALVQQDLNRYQSVVLSSVEATRLLDNANKASNHCVILQSEDGLFLDMLTHVYILRLLGLEGEIDSKRLLSASIPDVMTVPRAERVVTEDIESIIETAYLTPTEFDLKIYVIDKCETMNDAAQNKLLKLLEEPPSSCKFILKTTSKYALLPTVLSRSEIIELQPLSNSAILNALPDDVDDKVRALIDSTCFGRLDYALRVINDENYIRALNTVFEVFFDLKRSSDLAKVTYKVLKFKDYIELVIFFIECILHDCMVYSIRERNSIYFKHKEREIAVLSGEYVVDVVLALTESIKRARLRLKSYGNVTGIVEELLFSMLEVKTKWQRL